jgi:hypothetical protein
MNPMNTMTDNANSVADDMLRGAKQIGAELGLDPGTIWRLLQKGLIPARKLGPRIWIASRRELRGHFIPGAQGSLTAARMIDGNPVTHSHRNRFDSHRGARGAPATSAQKCLPWIHIEKSWLDAVAGRYIIPDVTRMD